MVEVAWRMELPEICKICNLATSRPSSIRWEAIKTQKLGSADWVLVSHLVIQSPINYRWISFAGVCLDMFCCSVTFQRVVHLLINNSLWSYNMYRSFFSWDASSAIHINCKFAYSFSISHCQCTMKWWVDVGTSAWIYKYVHSSFY